VNNSVEERDELASNLPAGAGDGWEVAEAPALLEGKCLEKKE
jgi:hypothetical protein